MSAGPRIPAGEALLRGAAILDVIKAKSDRVIVAGSIRRGLDEVGDLDVVAVNMHYSALDQIKDLAEWSPIERPVGYVHGKHFDRHGFRVDVFQATERTLGTVLAYATGSAVFNRMLEEYVPRDSLWDGQWSTEERFFRHRLKIPFIPPEQRHLPAIIEDARRLMAAAWPKRG